MNTKPDFDTLYQTAENQAGYFTASQARDFGYSVQNLAGLTKRGQFKRVQHGIYRLVHFPATRFDDYHVASLRTGLDSVISHESALALFDLSDIMSTNIHVIIPRSGSRRRKGMQLHTHKLRDDEITQREGLLVTTVERTIADVITSGVSYQHVKQAIQEALQRGLTTKKKLSEQADKRQGRVGKIIRRALQD